MSATTLTPSRKLTPANKTVVFTRDPDGTHRYMGPPDAIEQFRNELRGVMATNAYIAGTQAANGGSTNPGLGARKPMSQASRLKLAAAAKKRWEAQRAQTGQEGKTDPVAARGGGKKPHKTMAAGSATG
jgi:hypothetical protein